MEASIPENGREREFPLNPDGILWKKIRILWTAKREETTRISKRKKGANKYERRKG